MTQQEFEEKRREITMDLFILYQQLGYDLRTIEFHHEDKNVVIKADADNKFIISNSEVGVVARIIRKLLLLLHHFR